MNSKQTELYRVLNIVTDCCNMDIDGDTSFTADDVIGKSRTSNLVMTRCIFVYMVVIVEGYSLRTCASLLKRTEQAIRHLLELGYDYDKISKAYRIAKSECILRCRDELNKK